MDYKKIHDDLTRRYYLEGNPDKLSLAEFTRQHNAIWIQKDLDDGIIAQDQADELSLDVEKRAAILESFDGK